MNSARFACIFALFAVVPEDLPACETRSEWIDVEISSLMKERWRRHSETGFGRVDLDINGDGAGDQASLVVSRDGSRSAIKICLGPTLQGAGSACQIVAEAADIHIVMGLEKRGPGCYEFYEDDSGQSSEGRVCTKHDVLEYFRFASSSSLFIYDSQTASFRRYWQSR